MLYQHGILFLFLSFLLRILFCLKNICPWLLIDNVICLGLLFFWLYSLLLFIFISGMSLHRSSTFCSHPFHSLVVNKSFKFKYQMTNHKKWSSYQTKTTLLLKYCCHKSTVVAGIRALWHEAVVIVFQTVIRQ